MPKIHVVIHHQTDDLTLDQASLAIRLGADGVFLISHEGRDSALLPLCKALKSNLRSIDATASPAPLVGLNLLKAEPVNAFELAMEWGADALWVSSPGVTSSGVTSAGRRLEQLVKANQGPNVFGCVAFKYQPIEPDPQAAARAALALGMHPTTSGAGTGMAPDIEKIRGMSSAVGGKLAIASGMTPDNIESYAPFVSDVLVSTGVSQDTHRIDPDKFLVFREKARSAGRYFSAE